MEERLQDILSEIEQDSALRKAGAFRSTLNQPNLVALSSVNATDGNSDVEFSSFTVNLPRPILEAETLELVNANIPQCVQNIPNTACGFWYYRLSAYAGDVPSINNLHWCRLLPSYYKKELMTDPQLYGFNQTFHGYSDVSAQLALATKQDLADTNWKSTDLDITLFYRSQFAPYDIELAYDDDTNKFQMSNLNTWIPPAYLEWDIGSTYAVGDKVYYEEETETFVVSYTCIVANTGQEPNTTTGFWVEDNGPIIQDWDGVLTYGEFRIVNFSDVLYQSIQAGNLGNNPSTSPLWWEVITSGVGDFVWNRYLSTGYNDPNVARVQGHCYRPYDDVTLFEDQDVVEYNGRFYKSNKQTLGAGIPSADWDARSTAIQSMTNIGVQIIVKCDTTFFAGVAMGTPVFIVGNSTEEYNLFPTNNFSFYANTYTFQSISGDTVILFNDYFDADTPVDQGFGGQICLDVAPEIGLRQLSGQYDFTLQAVANIPPQPYNPVPKRLLNSILGFTWNGQFTLAQFDGYSQNDPLIVEFTNTTLFNRMRPVPQYITQPIGILAARPPPLENDAAVLATVYTADGYCNLVYSSIISIYTSIVAGSTLNTQQNTNLLAMGTMNCGNLGVSFFAPFINNPLLVNGGDLFTILIELQDEFGDPYILTNNAVASFVLKVTYKKDIGK